MHSCTAGGKNNLKENMPLFAINLETGKLLNCLCANNEFDILTQ